jgi:hypothetical protein
MAVGIAPQPKFIAIGQTVAAAAATEAGQNAGRKGSHKACRKGGNAKTKAEPAIVKIGEGHPDFVNRPYKLLTKDDHEKNFQWRKNNKRCTECGSSKHRYRKCEIREAKIRKARICSQKH